MFTDFFIVVTVAMAGGPTLTRCDMLTTSGFVDDSSYIWHGPMGQNLA